MCAFMLRDDRLVPIYKFYCDSICDYCIVPVSFIKAIFLLGGGGHLMLYNLCFIIKSAKRIQHFLKK